MEKAILRKKCIAAFAAAALAAGSMPFTVMAAETAEISCSVDGGTDVTNIGTEDGYITIDFSTDMDISTLNSTNITIQNGAGTAIEYTADATARQYKIDKKYFSSVKNNGAITTLSGDTFIINVANVKTADKTVQETKTFNFTTGTILPVSHKDGYIIENVALGKPVTTFGNLISGDKPEYITDGKQDNNWEVLRVDTTEESDAEFSIDLGKQYDIAGVAFAGGIGTDSNQNNWYTKKHILGGSNISDIRDMSSSNMERYIDLIDNNVLNYNQIRAKFFDNGTKSIQYIYGGTDYTKSYSLYREVYAWAYVPAANMVSATYPENGATGVTNIGAGNNSLVTIDFNTDMDVSTLNSNNIVIKNSAGDVIDYTPYSTETRKVSIDKKYFSSVKDNGAVTTLDGDTFTVTVSGARSKDGTVQESYSFSFTTGTVLPVSYKEGYIIENVALGKPVTELGTGKVSGDMAEYVTDGRQFNEWKVLRENVTAGNAAFSINLGRQYNIAGVAIAGVNNQWYDCCQIVGGSNAADETVMNNVTSYIKSDDSQINWNQVKAKFYDYGATAVVQYIYAGSNRTCLGCRELYVWAYIQAENMVESTVPANDAKDITNIGDNATSEISIKFSKAMDTSTLTSSNIIVKNGSGEIVNYSPKRVSETEYVLDTKVLANVCDKKIPSKETFTIVIGSEVTSADGNAQLPYEYKLTTDYIVAPVSSVEGKKIVNVAKGKIPQGNYSALGEHLGLTDGNAKSYDRYAYKNRTNQTDDGYCFKIDLDGWYDIAGIVIQSATDRANIWDNDHSRYLASADELDTMAGAEKFAEITDNNGIHSGQTIGKFYEYENSPRYRYVYGGPRAGYYEERELVVGEVYAFAYVDKDEDANTIRLREYDIDNFEIKVSGNTFSAVCKADREMNGTEKMIAALYKDGKLVETATAQNNNGSFATQSISVPSDWTTFPAKDEHYEIKTFIWNGSDGMKPVLKSKTGIMPNISCWGDSLTYSYTTEGTSWPKMLQEKLGNITTVNNFGLGGDTAADTAGRFGAVPFVLTEEATINGATPIKIESPTGYLSQLMKYLGAGDGINGSENTANSGINPCYIGGVKGSLHYEDEEYIFVPEDETQTVTAAAGTPIITNASLNNREDIQIFMVGANGGFGASSTTYALLEKQMVDYISSDVKKYIVIIGPKTHAPNMNVRENLFGDNCLNLYNYFRDADALTADGVELTETDKADIAEGNIPTSLMKDGDSVHLNAKGYSLLADKVYEKLNSLGYIPE